MLDVRIVGAIDLSTLPPPPRHKDASWNGSETKTATRDGTLWEEEHSRVLRCRPFSPPIVPPIVVGTGNTNDLDNSTCDEHARDQNEIVTVCFIGATCRYD